MKAIRFQRLKDGLKYGPITDDITSEWDEDMTDLYYRKAEVDAKIAELDGEIVRLREQLDILKKATGEGIFILREMV